MTTAFLTSELERVRLLVPALDRLLPGFAERTGGASEAAIAQLQAAANRPLPAPYVEFLRVAGARWGAGEPLLYSARFTVDAMIEFWRELEWPLPDRYVAFADSEDDPWEDLHLDIGQADAELALVRFAEPDGPLTEPPEDLSELDSSFTSMLFVRTYFDHCLPRWPNRQKAQSDRPIGEIGELDGADALLAKAGWQRHPLSWRWWRLFQRQDAELLVYEWRNNAPLAIEVVATTADACQRITDDLAGQLRLEPCRY